MNWWTCIQQELKVIMEAKWEGSWKKICPGDRGDLGWALASTIRIKKIKK